MDRSERDANRLESTVFGRTVRTRAHSLSVWFVLALGLMMGLAFLWSGADKLLGAEPFDAGRVLGLDPYVERYRVGGEPLIEKYPALG